MTAPAIREVGRRLRAARLACDLTLDAVAGKIGSCTATISCWENGHRQIPLSRFLELATLYGVTSASLLPDGGGVGPTSLPEQVRAIRMILDDITTGGAA